MAMRGLLLGFLTRRSEEADGTALSLSILRTRVEYDSPLRRIGHRQILAERVYLPIHLKSPFWANMGRSWP